MGRLEVKHVTQTISIGYIVIQNDFVQLEHKSVGVVSISDNFSSE